MVLAKGLPQMMHFPEPDLHELQSFALVAIFFSPLFVDDDARSYEGDLAFH